MNRITKECNRCKIPLGPNYEGIYCPDCQAGSRRHNKNRRDRMRATGQCMDCHKEREPECQAFLRCKDCLERRKQLNQARRDASKAITATTKKVVERIEPVKPVKPIKPVEKPWSERPSMPQIMGKKPNYKNYHLYSSCIYCASQLRHEDRNQMICNNCIQAYRHSTMTPEELAKAEALDKKYGL